MHLKQNLLKFCWHLLWKISESFNTVDETCRPAVHLQFHLQLQGGHLLHYCWRCTEAFTCIIETNVVKFQHVQKTIIDSKDLFPILLLLFVVFTEMSWSWFAGMFVYLCYRRCMYFQHNVRQTEKFSYLIVTRGEEAEAEGVDWARLIAPVQRRTRHVHCRLCTPDGQLQHQVVTARKHSRWPFCFHTHLRAHLAHKVHLIMLC